MILYRGISVEAADSMCRFFIAYKTDFPDPTDSSIANQYFLHHQDLYLEN
jgi:hypothetical protein